MVQSLQLSIRIHHTTSLHTVHNSVKNTELYILNRERYIFISMFDYTQHLPIDVDPSDNLHDKASALGIKYFMPVVSSLHVGDRGPLVPASAIWQTQRQGANMHGMSDYDMPVTAPECNIIPDPATLIQCPWNPEIGWLECFLYHEGVISPQCPRAALLKQIQLARDRGIVLKAGTELEFTLLKPDRMEVLDEEHGVKYEDPMAQMKRVKFIGRVFDAMDKLGWGPYHAEHEYTSNQYEINYGYTDALTCVDRTHFLKFMIKAIAQEEGFRVTYMPLPFDFKTDFLGNGMHCNVSLWSLDTDECLMTDTEHDLGLSKHGRHFLGGLMSHLKALTAIACPTDNSYKRLLVTKNFWNTATYGINSRLPAIRIVQENKISNRLELRFPDPSTNLYLLMAAILAAGLDGLSKNIEPLKEERLQLDLMTQEAPKSLVFLPRTLSLALVELKDDVLLTETIGTVITKAFIKKKEEHVNKMMHQVTPLEFKMVDLY